jgi:hypothetical protein
LFIHKDLREVSHLNFEQNAQEFFGKINVEINSKAHFWLINLQKNGA